MKIHGTAKGAALSTKDFGVAFGGAVIPEPGIWYGDRGVFAGGYGASNVLDYIDITSTGNATDFGDLLAAQDWLSSTGVSNQTRLCWAGGNSPKSNVIQYVTVSTTGNATDFGDLTVARAGTNGVSNGSRGCIMGGQEA